MSEPEKKKARFSEPEVVPFDDKEAPVIPTPRKPAGISLKRAIEKMRAMGEIPPEEFYGKRGQKRSASGNEKKEDTQGADDEGKQEKKPTGAEGKQEDSAPVVSPAVVRFFKVEKEKYGLFSNFAKLPIEMEILDGYPVLPHPMDKDGEKMIWPTSEHYYQGMKYNWKTSEDGSIVAPPENKAFVEILRSIPTAGNVAFLGRLKRNRRWKWQRDTAEKYAEYYDKVKINPNWDTIKYEVMLRAVRAKYWQHPTFRELLLSTGKAKIEEDSPFDSIWGIGCDGKGLNWLGQILMQVRDEHS